MRLIDLLSIVADDNHLKVIDCLTDEILAEYNGRDSIPKELNDNSIMSVTVDKTGCILVYVYNYIPVEVVE